MLSLRYYKLETLCAWNREYGIYKIGQKGKLHQTKNCTYSSQPRLIFVGWNIDNAMFVSGYCKYNEMNVVYWLKLNISLFRSFERAEIKIEHLITIMSSVMYNGVSKLKLLILAVLLFITLLCPKAESAPLTPNAGLCDCFIDIWLGITCITLHYSDFINVSCWWVELQRHKLLETQSAAAKLYGIDIAKKSSLEKVF